jgi:hypothetical protein
MHAGDREPDLHASRTPHASQLVPDWRGRLRFLAVVAAVRISRIPTFGSIHRANPVWIVRVMARCVKFETPPPTAVSYLMA